MRSLRRRFAVALFGIALVFGATWASQQVQQPTVILATDPGGGGGGTGG